MNFCRYPLSLAVASWLLAASAHANLLTNGSFEDALVADGTYVSGTATGWTGFHLLMNPDAAGNLAGSSPPAWPQAFAGDQYVDIGNGVNSAPPLSQNFTVLTAGAYTVSWNDHTALGFSFPPYTSPYSVAVSGASTWASGTLDAFQGSAAWGSRSFLVNLNAGSNTLSFTSLPGQTLDSLIDNVSITAVPEPGSWALLLAGIATVGSIARRRNP